MTMIASILLASTDPDRLRGWYLEALGLTEDADGFLDCGIGLLVDQRDDVAPRTAEPGRVVLNHHVPDIRAAERRLDIAGAQWVSPVEYRDAGLWFGTVEDPDGNLVQLIEETPAYAIGKVERAGGTPGPLVGATAAPRLPAQDLARARRFYAEVLGLVPVEERDGGLRYRCGATTFVVFASTGRASGDHTQLAFEVADLDRTVAMLRERGVDVTDVVEIEGHYPSSGASGERACWFHDSEGNLFGVSELVRHRF